MRRCGRVGTVIEGERYDGFSAVSTTDDGQEKTPIGVKGRRQAENNVSGQGNNGEFKTKKEQDECQGESGKAGYCGGGNIGRPFFTGFHFFTREPM